jgi:kynurenine 3-monooxygenase
LPLGETEPVLEQALAAYSDERDKDLRAITELAMQN